MSSYDRLRNALLAIATMLRQVTQTRAHTFSVVVDHPHHSRLLVLKAHESAFILVDAAHDTGFFGVGSHHAGAGSRKSFFSIRSHLLLLLSRIIGDAFRNVM